MSVPTLAVYAAIDRLVREFTGGLQSVEVDGWIINVALHRGVVNVELYGPES